ncbi:MAG TPA: DUF1697 domain-containing protein [Gammaproteobacteria bacterium]|nr:DUF1697 domain-containing protein [Gammaproteobacteria bacterium]
MPRYVAFLRGVSPMNAKMAALKACFERAGYTSVKTVLSSGNVAFDSERRSPAALVTGIEAAMKKELGRSFSTLVRPQTLLQQLVESDPFARHRVPAGAKRVVTFLRAPLKERLTLPIDFEGATILAADGSEIFTAYTPSPKGPMFMTLIEKTFGKDVTTRTWETVRKCARA